VIDIACECEGLPVREYQPDEVIIVEGGRSGALYFLKAGQVVVSREGVVLAELGEAGTVLGEISILLDRPHIAEVRADGPVEMHIAEDAEAFLREHPEVNLYIARALAKKVDAMSCYLTDLKRQYEGEEGHLGMVHEVLDSIMNLKS
jgi:CRP-like cAMP-binding protein